MRLFVKSIGSFVWFNRDDASINGRKAAAKFALTKLLLFGSVAFSLQELLLNR